MSKSPKSTWLRRPHVTLQLYALLIVGLGLLVLLQVVIHLRPFGSEIKDKVTDFDSHQLEVVLEMNKLVATLSTLVFGALGAVAFNSYKTRVIPRAQMARGTLCSVSVMLALYFVHLSYGEIAWMLGNSVIDFGNQVIAWPMRLSFLFFILATTLLADFTYRALGR